MGSILLGILTRTEFRVYHFEDKKDASSLDPDLEKLGFSKLPASKAMLNVSPGNTNKDCVYRFHQTFSYCVNGMSDKLTFQKDCLMEFFC